MDKKTKGAWLLAQSKSLDGVQGAGAARLENISYAGRVGRLYNLLRRNVADDPNPTIPKQTVDDICKLNGLDKAMRQQGMELLRSAGRIDIATNGAVSVLGATTTAVLEVTAEIFADQSPTNAEEAVLEISEKVAERPLLRVVATEYVGDLFKLATGEASSLIDLCKSTAIIDEESTQDRAILFNSNTFRDGQYAVKVARVLDGLSQAQRAALSEVHEKLRTHGALHEADGVKILGKDLCTKMISIGLFDRLEVSNSSEAVGYITSPNDFQKYGRPFEDDPVDDAKALIASLTYGQTRSAYSRGQITMPEALLNALIAGREIGGDRGVTAIGEDYRELERRQVVKVINKGHGRYKMKLLKKDVGELALTIVRGGMVAQDALLLDGSPATNFKGPHEIRTAVRAKNTIGDKKFVADALNRLRSGG
jgi:hypothetical protein